MHLHLKQIFFLFGKKKQQPKPARLHIKFISTTTVNFKQKETETQNKFKIYVQNDTTFEIFWSRNQETVKEKINPRFRKEFFFSSSKKV